MVAIASSGRVLSDVLKWDEKEYSREEVIVKSGSGVLDYGTVLAIETATNKVVPYEAGGAGGLGVIAGILISKVDATSADQKAVMVARFARVVVQMLIWHAGVDATEQAAGIVALRVMGIIPRQGA